MNIDNIIYAPIKTPQDRVNDALAVYSKGTKILRIAECLIEGLEPAYQIEFLKFFGHFVTPTRYSKHGVECINKYMLPILRRVCTALPLAHQSTISAETMWNTIHARYLTYVEYMDRYERHPEWAIPNVDHEAERMAADAGLIVRDDFGYIQNHQS